VADIFISYVRDDSLIAKQLADQLSARGYQVWHELESLSDARFKLASSEVQREVKAVIAIWSKNSIKSDFMCDEVDYALSAGKLIAVLAEGLDYTQLPEAYRSLEVVAVSNVDGITDRLCKLAVRPARNDRSAILSGNITEKGSTNWLLGLSQFLETGTNTPKIVLSLLLVSALFAIVAAQFQLLYEKLYSAKFSSIVFPILFLIAFWLSLDASRKKWTYWLENLPKKLEGGRSALINAIVLCTAAGFILAASTWLQNENLFGDTAHRVILAAPILLLAGIVLFINQVHRLNGSMFVAFWLLVSASITVIFARFPGLPKEHPLPFLMFFLVIAINWVIVWHRGEKLSLFEIALCIVSGLFPIVFLRPVFSYLGIEGNGEYRYGLDNIDHITLLLTVLVIASLWVLWRSRALSSRNLEKESHSST
jgi:hypothetical protein